MNDIIRLLPDSVANQIAAGEVIQRPSSVIKELVENSIDAQATMIQVAVYNAGKACIKVVDDGKGMSDTDARMCFERHATSKITQATDLYSLSTMGFRGEALASIAAVAQVELLTRTATDDIGTRLNIEGCKVTNEVPERCPCGTSFTVRNIFFNIPARRKFLKSNHTEMNNITQEFERVALAHPGIGFSLYSDDALLFNLQAGSFRQRIRSMFGRRMDERLVPISVDTSLVKVSGFVGKPESAKKKGAQQFFFVNGRFMRHPYFAKAIQMNYDRIIGDGETVPFFVTFEVDPSTIDVNIHPQKTEIKFENEQAIFQILQASVRESLGKVNAIPSLDFSDHRDLPEIPVFDPTAEAPEPPTIHIDQGFNPFEQSGGGYSSSASSSSSSSSRPATHWSQRQADALDNLYKEAKNDPLTQPLPVDDFEGRLSWTTQSDAPDEGPFPLPHSASTAPSAASNAQQPQEQALYHDLPAEEQAQWTESINIMGQYIGRFIVASTADGILFVDMRRAHIRLLYDTFIEQLSRQRGITQGLLFPQALTIQPSDREVFTRILPSLTALGFDIRPTKSEEGTEGDNAASAIGQDADVTIYGIPAGSEGLDAAELVLAMIEDAQMGREDAAETLNHKLALSLARRAAMPRGQVLTKDEMKAMLRKLFASSNANYTPSGSKIQYLLRTTSLTNFFDA